MLKLFPSWAIAVGILVLAGCGTGDEYDKAVKHLEIEQKRYTEIETKINAIDKSAERLDQQSSALKNLEKDKLSLLKNLEEQHQQVRDARAAVNDAR